MFKNPHEDLLKSVSFKVGTLREARKRFSAQLAPDFNIFDYLRNDEMGVSRIVADLLDPNGSHGQGNIFLRIFAEKIGHEWIATTDEWSVATEKQANGQRRIDVYLTSNVGVVGIENKPWAGDQKDQLRDYGHYIKSQAIHSAWLLVYIGNDLPSEESISTEALKSLVDSRNFEHISYKWIVEWLGDCASQTRALAVRIFIEEFAKFVRSSINGELDMSEEKEVIGEIRKSDGSIASAFHIANTMTTLKQELLQSFHDELKKALEEKEFHLVWDQGMFKGWGSCVGFGVKRFKEQDKYLRFEFEGAGLNKMLWGIRRVADTVSVDEAIWKKINDEMMSQFGQGKEWPWWPWCSVVPDHVFDKNYRDWGTSEQPWIEINRRKLTRKFVDLAENVYKGFGDKYFLLYPKVDLPSGGS